MYSAPQLALSVGFLFESLSVGAPPQLVLPGEFLLEILFAGAPPQLALPGEFLLEILFAGAPVLHYFHILLSYDTLGLFLVIRS